MPTLPPIADLGGRSSVVTGASDGIGVEVAVSLARAGAEVILPVRNAEKGDAAAHRIRAAAPGARVSTRRLDLSSLDSVAEFVGTMLAEERPVHILVANAGVMTPPSRRETADGFELQWGTNHLGHAAMILGLLPLLIEGDARVTHQTSIIARSGRIDWDAVDSVERYDAMGSYRSSKIAIGLFARELDRRSRESGWGVSSNLAHPGVSPTNLLAAQPGMGRDRDVAARRAIRVLARWGITGSVESAARPAVVAAAGEASQGDEFYGPARLIGGPPARVRLWKPLDDRTEGAKVWKETLRSVGTRFAV